MACLSVLHVHTSLSRGFVSRFISVTEERETTTTTFRFSKEDRKL